MGRIVLSENITLDGVVQDPAGDEGFEHGGWVGRIGDESRAASTEVLLDEALSADVLLLGRHSYTFFAGRWPSRTGALADRLNDLPKFVVSSTLSDPSWNNTTVLSGDPVTEVAALKQQYDGEILVYASIQLAQALLEHDLVDEIRLLTYPLVLGTGRRLFSHHGAKTLLLRTVDTLGDGLARLTYQPTRGD